MLFKSILLSIDLNDKTGWQRSTAYAAKMAEAFGAELHIVSVLPDFGMSIVGSYFDKSFEQQALKDMEDKLKQFATDHVPASVTSTVHIGHGSIYDQIMKFASDLNCDAIVIGAHRPELKDYLLGPNAARVVRHATQSVFVIRD